VAEKRKNENFLLRCSLLAIIMTYIFDLRLKKFPDLDCLPKVISKKVGQTCGFASIPRRVSPPFLKLLLANAITVHQFKPFAFRVF